MGKLINLFNSLFKSKTTKTMISPQQPEKTFAGIPLAKLSELAKTIYKGISCTIDECGFLVFHYKSNRGRQTLHDQIQLDKTGKLINLGGYFPGQWSSTTDEFIKKANELFKFK